MDENGKDNSSSHDENQSKNFQDVDDPEYKTILATNDSNVSVTLKTYSVLSPFCVVPDYSKIIQPKEKYLYRQKDRFKFKLDANCDKKRKKQNLLGPVEWNKDILIEVTESEDSSMLVCTEKNLADYPQEKRMCLRKMHLKNELTSTSDRVNLYDILGLDGTEVRKLNIDEQKKVINKAYRKQMKTWHPDKNFGDGEIAVEIIVAKETLLDDERRARYHNEIDYDKGWLSLKRYKAIFWPDCYTDEQNEQYWRRIGLMVASLGLGVGGVVLTFLTAGSGAPVVVVFGAVFGGGIAGAGTASGMHTISKNSVVNECDVKSWALKGGIGFLGGAVVGGATVAITAGITGIGSAALESSAVTVGQVVKMNVGSNAIRGAVSGAIQEALNFVDKKKGPTKTLKQSEETREEEAAEELQEATFRCKSEGAYISKMVVTYLLNGRQIKDEVSGSGRLVKIPSDARQIKVRFQVRRPAWGDIMKYDRFKKTWFQPNEPHMFCYEKPPIERTFTISGSLWWEAVIRVSDEYHEETGEMC